MVRAPRRFFGAGGEVAEWRPAVELAMLHPLNRARDSADVECLAQGPPGPVLGLHPSDGPIGTDALRELIIGRVAGRWEPPGAGRA